MSILGFDGRAGFTAPPPVEVQCKILFEQALDAKVPEEIPVLLAPMFPHCKPGVQPYRNPQNPEWVTQLPSYEFRSEDKQWKADLTGFTLVLTTWQYTVWHEFVRHLDFLLTQLSRGGYPMNRMLAQELLYRNQLPRPEGGTWRDILQAPYLGALADGSLSEEAVGYSSLTACLDLGSRCQLHMTSGLTERPKGGNPEEDRFQLDLKLTSRDRIAPDQLKQRLDWIHDWAVRVFQGAFLRQPLPGASVPPSPADEESQPEPAPAKPVESEELFEEPPRPDVRPEPSPQPKRKRTIASFKRVRAGGGQMHPKRQSRSASEKAEGRTPDYYDDVLPPDWQQEKAKPVSREVIRKVALIFACASVTIFLCILGLYFF